MIRKIAISGMKGRKKDTFLITFVVALSFLFIIIALTFHSSSEFTKQNTRITMFGSWEASYLNGNEDIKQRLLDTDKISKMGSSRILGQSPSFGTIGTYNEELLDMGYFDMYEGRLPEKDNEIALELNQLSFFNENVKVGDTVLVDITIPLFERDQGLCQDEQQERLRPELERLAADMKIDSEEEFYQMYYNVVRDNTRNEQSLEKFGDTTVLIRTKYYYEFINYDFFNDGTSTQDNTTNNVEDTIKYGSMMNQEAVITREMLVTGIVNNYSNMWDVGEYPVANTFMTEEAGQKFIENGFLLTEIIDVSNHETVQNLFMETKSDVYEFFNTYCNDFNNLRINSYAYPNTKGTTESTLTYGIVVFIFIATIFAVFQIYLTQMKRRSRKIALLKSIGATNGQIGQLLVWEVIYLLLLCIPIGIVFGLGIVWLLILFLNQFGNTNLIFNIDYYLLTLGIITGVVAVFIGMIIPMLIALRIPLTGTISKPPKHKKSFNKLKQQKQILTLNNYEQKLKNNILTFRSISIRHAMLNRGKNLITAGLYTITISTLIGTLFLSFLFFNNYINEVVATDKPSYSFELDYGMRKREIPNVLEKLYGIEGIERVELYKAGERAFLWYDGIKNNETQTIFKNIIPPRFIEEHFGQNSTSYTNLNNENVHLVRDAVVSNIYGIDTEDPLYQRFEQAISKGKLDKDKFDAGEEVILMLPIYQSYTGNMLSVVPEIEESLLLKTEQKSRMHTLLNLYNLMDITYDFRMKNIYNKDSSINVGEMINLAIPTENYKENTFSNDVALHSRKVAAIINYIPKKGIWPFSGSVENPVVIGSYNLIGQLYPGSISGIGYMSMEHLRALIQSLTPTRYGKTWIHLYETNKADDVQTKIAIERVAREYDFKLYNYKVDNDSMFGKAFNVSCIIIIMGLSIAIITLIILYNTTLSKLEQERDRIGILQALGVTNPQFHKLYLSMGLFFGMVSLVIAHILLGIAVISTSISGNKGILMDFKDYLYNIINNQLWMYPWGIHALICVLFLIFTVLTYYLPIRKIIKNQPVDNIRSLNR